MKLFLYIIFVGLLPLLLILKNFKIKFNNYKGIKNYKNVKATKILREKFLMIIFMIFIGVTKNILFNENITNYQTFYILIATYLIYSGIGNKNVYN